MPILISLLLALLMGCQSGNRRAEEYHAIKVGMKKSDVLSTAGNPKYTDRKKGIDRWYYYLRPREPETIRVVHFKNGKVVYKGLRIQPKLTTEDAIKSPKAQPYTRSLSDEELKQIIKKELRKKSKPKVKLKFEEI